MRVRSPRAEPSPPTFISCSVAFLHGDEGKKTHNNPHRARVNPTLTLCRGHPLNPMHARFPPQHTKRPLSHHLQNRLPVCIPSPHSHAGEANALDEGCLPPLPDGETRVHPNEFGCEEGGFGSADAGFHFEDGREDVGWCGGEEGGEKVGAERAEGGGGEGEVAEGQVAEFGIWIGGGEGCEG